ncbi:hypothetical protein AB0950_24885 [Streptomyces sp. NPDC007189]|uniref:hypothetical protein n=1 Tax=Streptomyces sp. NPDC007189 TaxID=3154315 RepID=UPI003456DB84
MPEDKESAHSRSGRLFAALAALHFLAAPGRTLPGPDAFKPKDELPKRLQRLKQGMYDDLVLARARGGAHWKAASEVFRSIPSFLDPGPLSPHTISLKESADHRAGYDAQLAALKKDFPGLLP